MLIENLVPNQRFLYEGRKFKLSSLSLDHSHVWLETTNGTLIRERIGTYVEEIH